MTALLLLCGSCARYWADRVERGEPRGWHRDCLVHRLPCPAATIPACGAAEQPARSWEDIAGERNDGERVTVHGVVGYELETTLIYCYNRCCNRVTVGQVWLGDRNSGAHVIASPATFAVVADDSAVCPLFPTDHALRLTGEFTDGGWFFDLESVCDPLAESEP